MVTMKNLKDMLQIFQKEKKINELGWFYINFFFFFYRYFKPGV